MDLIPWRNKSGSKSGRQSANVAGALPDEIENVFDRFWRDPWNAGWAIGALGAGGFPQLDLAESDNDVTVRAELPGMKPRTSHRGDRQRAEAVRREERAERRA